MSHEHLSDEQLSASIDGEPLNGPTAVAAPDARAEMATCASCRERLTALEEARALVRFPVTPVSPSVRVAALKAALADAPPAEAAGAETAVVVPMASLSRSSRPSRVLIGAAAVVVVLALAAGIPIALSHGGSRTTNSATHAKAKRPAPLAVVPRAAGATGIADLGPISSEKALRSHLVAELASGPSPGELNSSSGLTATGTQSASTAQSVAPFGTAGDVPEQLATCVAVAHEEVGVANTLVLVANVTYTRTPALVVVVQVTATVSGTKARHGAVVVARSDCHTLARITF
jgi:hypothetical protein